jgi:NCS1 family nucleobase:cation symporter-1
VTVTDGATELYYLNYLYGYVSSVVLYTSLHWIFPSRNLDSFVAEPTRARDLQKYYTERWDTESLPASLLGSVTHLSEKNEPSAVVKNEYAA